MKLFGNGWNGGIVERDVFLAGLAAGRFQCAEIAAERRLRGYVTDRLGRGSAGARRLVARKNKQLVLFDGSSDQASELVAPQRILRGGEEIARVEVSVADEFEQAAMELVGSRLGHDIDDRAGMQPVARGNAVGLHAEFLQGVGEGKRQVHIGMRIVVIAAVEQIVIPVDLASGYGDADSSRVIVRRDDAARRVRRHHRSAGEQDQIGRLPSIEREVHDPALIDDLGDGGVLRLHHYGVGRHSQLLRHGPDLQRDVHQDIVPDLQHDSRLNIACEALSCGFETIRTDREVGKQVRTIRAGDRRSNLPCVGLGRLDLSERNESARRIPDLAVNRGVRYGLCKRLSGAPECSGGSRHPCGG